jgi:hypothetical protein
MVSRVVKNSIRFMLRKAVDKTKSEATIIELLNLLFSRSKESMIYWDTTIKVLLLMKFDPYAQTIFGIFLYSCDYQW